MEKHSRISTSEARIPVALVAFFFLCYLLLDSIDRSLWYAASIEVAALVGVLYWLLVPEVRKRRR